MVNKLKQETKETIDADKFVDSSEISDGLPSAIGIGNREILDHPKSSTEQPVDEIPGVGQVANVIEFDKQGRSTKEKSIVGEKGDVKIVTPDQALVHKKLLQMINTDENRDVKTGTGANEVQEHALNGASELSEEEQIAA